jgi:hypothetical protein
MADSLLDELLDFGKGLGRGVAKGGVSLAAAPYDLGITGVNLAMSLIGGIEDVTDDITIWGLEQLLGEEEVKRMINPELVSLNITNRRHIPTVSNVVEEELINRLIPKPEGRIGKFTEALGENIGMSKGLKKIGSNLVNKGSTNILAKSIADYNKWDKGMDVLSAGGEAIFGEDSIAPLALPAGASAVKSLAKNPIKSLYHTYLKNFGNENTQMLLKETPEVVAQKYIKKASQSNLPEVAESKIAKIKKGAADLADFDNPSKPAQTYLVEEARIKTLDDLHTLTKNMEVSDIAKMGADAQEELLSLKKQLEPAFPTGAKIEITPNFKESVKSLKKEIQKWKRAEILDEKTFNSLMRNPLLNKSKGTITGKDYQQILSALEDVKSSNKARGSTARFATQIRQDLLEEAPGGLKRYNNNYKKYAEVFLDKNKSTIAKIVEEPIGAGDKALKLQYEDVDSVIKNAGVQDVKQLTDYLPRERIKQSFDNELLPKFQKAVTQESSENINQLSNYIQQNKTLMKNVYGGEQVNETLTKLAELQRGATINNLAKDIDVGGFTLSNDNIGLHATSNLPGAGKLVPGMKFYGSLPSTVFDTILGQSELRKRGQDVNSAIVSQLTGGGYNYSPSTFKNAYDFSPLVKQLTKRSTQYAPSTDDFMEPIQQQQMEESSLHDLIYGGQKSEPSVYDLIYGD